MPLFCLDRPASTESGRLSGLFFFLALQLSLPFLCGRASPPKELQILRFRMPAEPSLRSILGCWFSARAWRVFWCCQRSWRAWSVPTHISENRSRVASASDFSRLWSLGSLRLG